MTENNKDEYMLLDYFLEYGINVDDQKDDINSLKCRFPKQLFHYPIKEQNTKLLELIHNERIIILSKIFPSLTDCIDKIKFSKGKNYKYYKRPFEDYVVEKLPLNQRKMNYFVFNHIFSEGDIKEYYFNCFLFWDEYKFENDLGNEQSIFIAKAFVIVSRQPCFNLCYHILNALCKKAIEPQAEKKNSIEEDLLIILNLEVKNDRMNIITIKSIIKDYYLPLNTFVPLCDINLCYFFSIFPVDDLLDLLPIYLFKENIIVISNDIQILFPFHFIVNLLLHPIEAKDETQEFNFSLLSEMSMNLFKEQASLIMNKYKITLYIYSENFDIIESMKSLKLVNSQSKPFHIIKISKKNDGSYDIKKVLILNEGKMPIQHLFLRKNIFHKMISNQKIIEKSLNNIKKIIREVNQMDNVKSFFGYNSKMNINFVKIQYECMNLMIYFLYSHPIYYSATEKKVVCSQKELLLKKINKYSDLVQQVFLDISEMPLDNTYDNQLLLYQLLFLKKRNQVCSFVFKSLPQIENIISVSKPDNKIEKKINEKKEVINKKIKIVLLKELKSFQFLLQQKIITFDQYELGNEIYLLGLLYSIVVSFLYLNGIVIKKLYEEDNIILIFEFMKKTQIFHLLSSLITCFIKSTDYKIKSTGSLNILTGLPEKIFDEMPKANNYKEVREFPILYLDDNEHRYNTIDEISFNGNTFSLICPLCGEKLKLLVMTNESRKTFEIFKPSLIFDRVINNLIEKGTVFFDTKDELSFLPYKEWENDYYIILLFSQFKKREDLFS